MQTAKEIIDSRLEELDANATALQDVYCYSKLPAEEYQEKFNAVTKDYFRATIVDEMYEVITQQKRYLLSQKRKHQQSDFQVSPDVLLPVLDEITKKLLAIL